MRTLTTTLSVLCLAGAAVPASASALGTGGDCGAQCITKAWITPHPRAFSLEVKTNTPARIRVSVGRRLASGHLVWVGTTASPPGRTSFAGHVSGLEPDRVYEVVVTATDAEGRVARRSTPWRTLGLETLGDGGPTSFDSGAGCAAQCIQTATAATGGTGAQLTVDTTVAARLHIQADRDAPGTIGGTPVFGSPEADVHTTKLRTHWTGALNGLKPGSRYHVIVRATDADGRFAVRQGVLHTDERHARVVFTGIRVHDDADKGRNRGELQFRFEAEGVPRFVRGEDKIKSGEWVDAPDRVTVLHDAPRILDLAVQGIERDWRGCFSFNSGGDALRSPDSGHKKTKCNRWTWTTARGKLDLDATVTGGDSLPPGFGGSGMHNFVLFQGRGKPRFDAHGHVEVWYE